MHAHVYMCMSLLPLSASVAFIQHSLGPALFSGICYHQVFMDPLQRQFSCRGIGVKHLKSGMDGFPTVAASFNIPYKFGQKDFPSKVI